MNRVRTSKAVRGAWADAKRGEYLLEREIVRSYKKDPVGAEMMTKLVLEPLKALLDITDAPIAEAEDNDFAMSLAGSNNFTADTYRRKLDKIMPEYIRLMSERGIDVQLVERRRIIATLVPNEGRSA